MKNKQKRKPFCFAGESNSWAGDPEVELIATKPCLSVSVIV